MQSKEGCKDQESSVEVSNIDRCSSKKERIERISLEIDKCKVGKGAKIRYRYNQVPHLAQDTNKKETN